MMADMEETRERLSSLIRQKSLTGGTRGDCYWVLLADSSTDRFVILQGIQKRSLPAAWNDEFHLVAAGNADSDDGGAVFWPGAEDLARVVHKIMSKMNRDPAYNLAISHKSATHGLVIYDLAGCEARLSTPVLLDSDSLLMWPSLDTDLDMEMLLSRVLKPPSVLAAASPSQDLVSVGMENNTPEAFGHELPQLAMNMTMTTTGDGNYITGGHNLRNLLQELAAAPPPHVLVAAAIEFLVRRWYGGYYDLEAQRRLDYDDLEVGGQADHRRVAHLLAAAAATAADGARRNTGSGAAAPPHEPSEAANLNLVEGVMVQAFASFLPACVTAYPLLKDAPDYVKLTVFGGLASITAGLFAGILSRSVARRGLAIRLVSFSAIAVLTFSVASQLTSRAFIALTALVGVAVNSMIMLLRF